MDTCAKHCDKVEGLLLHLLRRSFVEPFFKGYTMYKNEAVGWDRDLVQTWDHGSTDMTKIVPMATVTPYHTRNYLNFATGVDLPGYMDIIKNGGDATTAFNAEKHEFNLGRGTITTKWHYPAYPNIIHTNTTTGLNTPLALFAGADNITSNNLALNSFYKQILKKQQTFDGAVFTGELKETILMLKSPLQGLKNFLQYYLNTIATKRKGVRTVEEVKRLVTSTWLEVSFGMLPLVADITNILKMLTRAQRNLKQIRISAYGRSSATLGPLVYKSVINSYNFYTYTVFAETEVNTRYIVGYAPGTFKAPTDWEEWGFAPNRFVPTAWELLPYSWLYDYFSNIGYLIEAASARYYKPVWICKSVKTVANCYAYYAGDPGSARASMGTMLDSQFGDLGNANHTWTKYQRTAIKDMPLPEIQAKMPPGLAQWTNIAMVLAQGVNLQKVLSRPRSGR